MKNYVYFNTSGKLIDIFTDHCNLSMEQYEWISAEFSYLEADIQEDEPLSEIDNRIQKMQNVFDFLLETKELSLKEHAELNEFAEEMRESAIREGIV